MHRSLQVRTRSEGIPRLLEAFRPKGQNPDQDAANDNVNSDDVNFSNNGEGDNGKGDNGKGDNDKGKPPGKIKLFVQPSRV